MSQQSLYKWVQDRQYFNGGILWSRKEILLNCCLPKSQTSPMCSDCCSERAWGNLFLTHHLLLVKEKGAKPFAEKGKPCWILKAWSTLSEKENEDYGQQSFIELFFCFLYFASWRCSVWSPQEMHCSAVLLRPFWWVPLHRSTYRWKLMITRVESHSDVF